MYKIFLLTILSCNFIFTSDFIEFNNKRINYIDSLAYRLIDEKIYSGLSVYINSSDSIVYNKYFGLANIENKTPINDKTIFRIFSMTKPITSIAMMILLERGLIDLDTPIHKFLPEFKEMKKVKVINKPIIKHLFHFEKKVENEITIFHLLTHTSGFYYNFTSQYRSLYKKYNKSINDGFKTLKEFSVASSKLPLLFEPGTDFNYGISISILARVVEVVSGQNFEDFIQNEILFPLEMSNTSFNLDNSLKDIAVVYQNMNGTLELNNDFNIAPIVEFPLGGGGLFSTVLDYANFCLMLSNDGIFKGKRIISRNSLELMKINHIKYLDGKNIKNILKRKPVQLIEDILDITWPMDGFGLGFSINESMMNQTSIANNNKYGWNGIANTYFFIDDKNDFFVIIMGQSFPMNFSILRQFENVIYQAIEYKK